MNYLLLIKHSLPQIDPRVPAREWHLSAEGRARYVPLADQLAAYQPRAIFSSRDPKAFETAQIISARLGVALDTRAGLREHARARSIWRCRTV